MSAAARMVSPVPVGWAPSNATLYRRLLKLYISKFGTDHVTIIRAWKQTKSEFYANRLLEKPEEIERARKIATDAYHTVLGGIVPILTSKDRKQPYYKITKEMMEATQGNLDPVTGEEFVKKFKDYLAENDRAYIEAELKKVGKWRGETIASRPGEVKETDHMHTVKSKRTPTAKDL